jgi:hypothetical protein
VSAARKEFESFPEGVQSICLAATQGIQTPKHEIDLISARVKRLKEMLR